MCYGSSCKHEIKFGNPDSIGECKKPYWLKCPQEPVNLDFELEFEVVCSVNFVAVDGDIEQIEVKALPYEKQPEYIKEMIKAQCLNYREGW